MGMGISICGGVCVLMMLVFLVDQVQQMCGSLF